MVILCARFTDKKSYIVHPASAGHIFDDRYYIFNYIVTQTFRVTRSRYVISMAWLHLADCEENNENHQRVNTACSIEVYVYTIKDKARNFCLHCTLLLMFCME